MKKTYLIISFIGLLSILSPYQIKASATNSDTGILPVYFSKNSGQYPDNVQFFASTYYATVFVHSDGKLMYSIPFENGSDYQARYFSEHLIGATPHDITGHQKSCASVYSFKSDTQAVSEDMYKALHLQQVYPGINLELKINARNMEKIFSIAPGAEVSQIALGMEKIQSLECDESGQLKLQTEQGTLKFSAPLAFQYINGKKIPVDVKYKILSGTSYGFQVGNYDPGHELIIDPLLSSTFAGGSSNDYGMSLTGDINGNIFVTGYTWSSDYPVSSGAYDEDYNGGDYDVFVSKFDSTLNSLLASTYIGGSDYDMGDAIYADNTGNIYLTGRAQSTDFPTTAGVYSPSHNGGETDVFVAIFSNDLSSLQASTYIGGSQKEQATDIHFDETDAVFICGYTKSPDYPTTAGVHDAIYSGGGNNSGFVSRLNANLSSLDASSYLDGSNDDEPHAMAFDINGDLLITGFTESSNFPITPGAFDQTQNSNKDAFIARINKSLTNLMHSTFFGAGYYDEADDIITDNFHNIYIVGHTASNDYPTTSGAYTEEFQGAVDAFVAKFSDDLSTLFHSTFIGGSNWDYGNCIRMDNDHHLFISGTTYSSSFPTAGWAYDNTFNGSVDVFVSKMDTALNALEASTFIGGSDYDIVKGIYIDPFGQIYLTGYTNSEDYPTSPGAYDDDLNGTFSRDAFLTKFDNNLSSPAPQILEQPVSTQACENDTAFFSLIIDDETNVNYQWYQDSGSGFVQISGATNDSLYLPLSIAMDGSEIYCEVSNAGGVINSDTVNLLVDALIPAGAGDDQNLCENFSTILAADSPAPGSGLWSLYYGEGDITSPTMQNSQVTNLGNGENAFIWQVTNATCVSTDTMSVFVDTIIPANAGEDIMLCDISNATLSANNPGVGTGQWSLYSGSLNIQNTANPLSPVNGIDEGTHVLVWKITNGACEDTDSLDIVRDTLIEADAGMFQHVCETDTAILDANNASPGTGIWSVVQGNANFIEDDNPQTVITLLEYGENVLRWSISNGGCLSSDTVHVFRDSVVTPDAGPDLMLCDVDYAILTANDPFPGHGVWDIVSGAGTLAQSHQAITSLTGLQTDSTEIAWTITNGACMSYDTVIIDRDTTIYADAGADMEVCGDSTVLNGNTSGEGVGTWSFLEGNALFDNPGDPQTAATDLAPGANLLRWTIQNGNCTDYDQTEVYRYDILSASAGEDTTICFTDTLSLYADDPTPGVGTWSVLSGNANFTNVHNPYTLASNLAPDTNRFVWTVQNGACFASDTIEIFRDIAIFANTGEGGHICDDSTFLSAEMPDGYTAYWEIDEGYGQFEFMDSNQTSVTNILPDTNVFVFYVSNGFCTVSDQIQIIRDTLIEANPVDSIHVCDQPMVSISATNPAPGAGTWSIISGDGGALDDNEAYETTIDGLLPGETTLRWIVQNGACSDTAYLTITQDTTVPAVINDISFRICADSAEIIAESAYPGDGFWASDNSSISFEDADLPETWVYNLDVDTNEFNWIVNNGACTDSALLTVIRDTIIYAVTAPDTAICEQDTLPLSANNPFPGNAIWTISEGSGNILDNLSYDTELTELMPGDNIFTWTITNGACLHSNDILIHQDTIIPAITEEDFNVCTDFTSISAETADPGNGFWTIAEGDALVANPDAAVSNATDLQFGANVFVWTVYNGACEDTDSLEVYRDTVIPAIAGEDIRMCQTDSVQLSANAPGDGSGNWFTLSGNAEFENPQTPDSWAKELAIGENLLLWQIDIGNCSDTDTIQIIRDSAVAANAGEDQTLCDFSSTLLMGNGMPHAFGEWSVLEGDAVIAHPNQPLASIGQLSKGENILLWSFTNGSCYDEDTVSIFMYESIVLTKAPISKTILLGDTVQFSVEASGTINGYQWMKNGEFLQDSLNITGSDSTTLSIHRALYDAEAEYSCLLYGECGDLVSPTARLDLQKGIQIYPNPVSDYLIFEISRIYDKIDIQLYDNSGRLIYNEEVHDNRFRMNMRHYDAGTYHLRLVFDKEAIVYNITKI